MLIKGTGDFCRVVSRPMFLSIYKCLTLHVEMSIISSLIEEIHMKDQKKKKKQETKNMIASLSEIKWWKDHTICYSLCYWKLNIPNEIVKTKYLFPNFFMTWKIWIKQTTLACAWYVIFGGQWRTQYIHETFLCWFRLFMKFKDWTSFVNGDSWWLWKIRFSTWIRS